MFACIAAAGLGRLVALGAAAAITFTALAIFAAAVLLAFFHRGFGVFAFAARLAIFHIALVFAATRLSVFGIGRPVVATAFAVFHVGHLVMTAALRLRRRG